MTGIWSNRNIPKVNSSSPQWVIVSRLGWSIDLANRYRLKSVKPITLIIILLVSEKQKSQIVTSKTLIKRPSEIEVAARYKLLRMLTLLALLRVLTRLNYLHY